MSDLEVKYNYFSHSGIHTYLQCPKKWYLKYVERIKVPLEQKHLLLGNCVHDLLEHWKGGSKKQFLKFMADKINEYQLKDYYESSTIPIYFQNALKCWKEYVRPNLETATMERPFKNTIGKYKTSGKIDLFVPPTKFKKGLILDYKTGKKDEITAEYFKQLVLYSMMICKEDGTDISQYEVGCYFVKHGSFRTIEVTQEDIDDYRINFERYGDRVQRDEEFKKKVSPLCPWCEYYINGHCDGKAEPCDDDDD